MLKINQISNPNPSTSKTPKKGGGPRTIYSFDFIINPNFSIQKPVKMEGEKMAKKGGPRKRGYKPLNPLQIKRGL